MPLKWTIECSSHRQDVQQLVLELGSQHGKPELHEGMPRELQAYRDSTKD